MQNLPSRSPGKTNSQNGIEMENLNGVVHEEEFPDSGGAQPRLHDDLEDQGGSDDEDGGQGDGSMLALLEPHDRTRGRERMVENPLKLWPQIKSIVIEVSDSVRLGFWQY
jgi:hypothetical protein